jgi:hypothetical protein
MYEFKGITWVKLLKKKTDTEVTQVKADNDIEGGGIQKGGEL